jgi:hypothetical protein
MSRVRLFPVVIPWLVLAVVVVGPAAAQEFRFEYAVKLICGAPDRPALAPGRYYTAINIHNPSTGGIVLRKKFALTGPTESSVAPTPFLLKKLGPDYAFEVDCANKYLAEKRFAKGFAVIQSPIELDVVAVYTAGSVAGTDSLITMDLERVPGRAMTPTK